MPVRVFLIFGAFCVSVLMWMDRACISAAKGEMASDLNFTDSQMGWVMAAFSLGYALFQVPSGHLADHYGPRKVLSIVCVAWSFFTMMTGVIRGLIPLILLRFCFGMGESGGYPTLARAFSSWLPMNERGITNSISFSGGRLGAALAMPGVVWLITTLGGWQQTFLLFGAVGFVFALVWFLAFRDTPEEHFAVSQAERDYIIQSRNPARPSPSTDAKNNAAQLGIGQTEEAEVMVDEPGNPNPYHPPAKLAESSIASDAPQPEPNDQPGPPIRFIDMLRSSNMLMLMVQYVAHNFTFFFTVSWFFSYLKDDDRYSLTMEQTAWYAAAPLLCGVVGNWLAGFTVDRLYSAGKWQLSRRLPAAVGFALGAIGMVTCIHMETPVMAVAAMCVAIFGSDMILSPSWSTCMDIGGKSAGAVSGAMNMVGNLGAFTTSLAFPYLAAWTGTHVPFFYLAAGLNLLAIFMWFRIRPDVPMARELNISSS